MDYSITGIAYLFLSSALVFIVYRVFHYWKQEKDVISKVWLGICSVFGLFVIIKAIGGLFFATNHSFLSFTINFGVFLQAIALALMAYFSVYVKFSPKISPWWGFFPILILGIIATYFTIITPQNPFVELSGAINWGLPSTPSVATSLRTFLFVIVFLPAIFILFEQFQGAQDDYTKKKTLGFIGLLAIGIIGALLDFILSGLLKVDLIWRDVAFILASVVIFIAFFPGRKEKFI